jgi:hypothetical protein
MNQLGSCAFTAFDVAAERLATNRRGTRPATGSALLEMDVPRARTWHLGCGRLREHDPPRRRSTRATMRRASTEGRPSGRRGVPPRPDSAASGVT